MSMLGVPYSPIVPSFTRWAVGNAVAHREQQVQRADDVRVLRLHRGLARAHRVRSRGLLGVVDDRLRKRFGDHGLDELGVLDRAHEAADLLAGDLPPGLDALVQRADRRERVGRVVCVPAAPGEVVDDRDFVPALGEAHRRRPSQIPVATQDQDSHKGRGRVAEAAGTAEGRGGSRRGANPGSVLPHRDGVPAEQDSRVGDGRTGRESRRAVRAHRCAVEPPPGSGD